jgi:hypothetical protein
MLRTLLTPLLCCLTTCLSAGLVFEEPIELKPNPEDDVIEKTFTFENKGDKPVHITGLESTCSCLEATLDKADYAPGEKGTGKATFKVSSFVGRHEKVLHIQTDDKESPDIAVTFILDVPAVIDIEPKLLQWTLGEAPTTKEFIVKMTGEDPMKITNVTPTRQNVTLHTEEITAGREYRVKVTPSSTGEITVGAVKIETDSKIPKYARQMAFFNIIRPELAEKKAKAAAASE